MKEYQFKRFHNVFKGEMKSMESRIISIYSNNNENEYWYDIDGRMSKYDFFYEAQYCGGNKMKINVGDEVYLLCRYEDCATIRYKFVVEEINIPAERIIVLKDEYEHVPPYTSTEDYIVEYYFKAKINEIYKKDSFTLEMLRKKKMVSNHNQLNGDKVSEKLINFINDNKGKYGYYEYKLDL